MSRNSYARKAAQFEISNPEDDATEGQIRTCNWLLRTRQHSVEFGNDAIDLLSGGMTRGDADSMIKHLSKCPPNRKAPVEPHKAAERAIATVERMQTPDKAAAAAEIRRIARQHKIKLGVIAEKHLAIAAKA